MIKFIILFILSFNIYSMDANSIKQEYFDNQDDINFFLVFEKCKKNEKLDHIIYHDLRNIFENLEGSYNYDINFCQIVDVSNNINKSCFSIERY